MGIVVKQLEVHRKYFKNAKSIVIKNDSKNCEKVAITFYYDEEYFEYERDLFKPQENIENEKTSA